MTCLEHLIENAYEAMKAKGPEYFEEWKYKEIKRNANPDEDWTCHLDDKGLQLIWDCMYWVVYSLGVRK